MLLWNMLNNKPNELEYGTQISFVKNLELELHPKAWPPHPGAVGSISSVADQVLADASNFLAISEDPAVEWEKFDTWKWCKENNCL